MVEVTWLAREYDVEIGGVRQVVSGVVRSAWSSAQEWTVAWREGTAQLKTVVAGLLKADGKGEEGEDGHLPPSVHQAADQLTLYIAKMRDCVRTLKDLVEQIQKVERMQCEASTSPLFSTLSVHHMVCVLEQVYENYRCETDVKVGACTPLPTNRCPDILNTCVTLWTHHTHLHTHHFPLKLLLRETQQL
ncbi:hypothetical protein Pcinc_036617 [Petrolisthes cinctipes]|uniref:Uncharacterized protein n=1 Tax=Petrolisthes cinctipes TaxID=88211 RepID=A0AAE1BU10_PETCI|nr:hypothetical protein Pcinc_036617 [Petrolisthes cinctipes]